MSPTPIERNLVTRFALGLAVLVAMMLGGAAGSALLSSLDVPAARWAGVALGAVAVFVAFSAWYARYAATVDAG